MGLRPDTERGSPERWTRPTKTRGDRRGGLAAGSQPRGAIMGGGGNCVPELAPDSLQRGSPSPPGSSPEPVSARSLNPPRIPSEPVPDLPWSPPGMPPRARPGSPWSWSLSRCAPRGTGQVPLESASGMLGFTGSAARPSAGTHETRRRVPRSDPLSAAVPALRLAPGRRPRASALASPWCARSLPEPGLIWSRWRQAVGTAQPPQPACQYPAHNPPAARPRSHAHRARPLPLRDPLQIPGLRLPPTL